MGVSNIQVAIIGAGNMAQEHCRAFTALPDTELAGITSRTRTKAAAIQKEFSIPIVSNSITELYNETKADIAVVTVNAEAMLDIALACLQFPWTMLLEKPAGCNLAQAQKLVSAASNSNASVYVALNRRFLSSTEFMLDGLDADVPRYIHVQDQQSMMAARAYGHPDIVVDNCMYANSIHLIDYFSLLGRGEVIEVTNMHKWQGEDTRVMLSHICFASGDEGLYEGIWQGPGPWAVSVSTPEQRWEMRPLEIATLQKAGSREIQSFEQTTEDQQYKPGFSRQAQELVKAHRGQENRSVTLDQSMKSMQLVSRIFGME